MFFDSTKQFALSEFYQNLRLSVASSFHSNRQKIHKTTKNLYDTFKAFPKYLYGGRDLQK